MEKGLTGIQVAINKLLGVKSLVRRKKKSRVDKKKELFITIINSIEQIVNRQNLMYAELNLDLSNYDESFLDVIDALIFLSFGKEGTELISYYLWDRVDPTGEINPITDDSGNEIILENAQDLWNLLIRSNPNHAE